MADRRKEREGPEGTASQEERIQGMRRRSLLPVASPLLLPLDPMAAAFVESVMKKKMNGKWKRKGKAKQTSGGRTKDGGLLECNNSKSMPEKKG